MLLFSNTNTTLFAQYSIGGANQDTGNITNDDEVCSGQTATVAAGIIGGSETYTWSDASIGDNQTFNRAFTSNETFTVTITDGGDEVVQAINVVANAAPMPTITGATQVCPGGHVHLQPNASGIKYDWNYPPSNTLSLAPPGAIIISNVTGLSSGVYTVTVTNASGCTGTDEYEVTVGPPAAMASSNSVICPGQNLNLMEIGGDATAWVWSGPNSYTSTLQNPTISAATTAANGEYTVTVSTASGCSGTATVAVTVRAATAIASSNSPICEGADLNLMEMGGEATSWSWSGPDSFASTLQNPTIPNATTDADGDYFVTITNGNACRGISSIGVTVNTPPVPSITATENAGTANDGVICSGDNVTLDSGIAGATSYAWSGGGTNQTASYNPTSNTTYTVTVTDGSGCTGTDEFEVTVDTPTGIDILIQEDTGTPNDGAFCIGSFGTEIYTAPGFANYQWSLTSSNSHSLGVIVLLPFSTSIVFTVTVTNDTGCTASASSQFTAEALPAVSATSNSPICSGEDLDLMGTGSGGTNWAWSGPNSFASTEQNPTISGASAAAGGNYTVTLTTDIGCSSTAGVAATVNSASANIAIANNPICAGEDLNLMETGGDANAWAWSGPNSFTSTLQNPTISAATTAADGDYFVTVTNSNNCTATASTTTTVYSTPTVTTSNNSPICAGEDLNFRETGGEATGWTWSGPNSFTSTLQNPTISAATTAADGDYFVTVTNSNNCTATASTTTTVYPTPTVTTSNNSPICAGEDLTLMETGGEATGWAWSGPNSFTSTLQNPTISAATTAADGDYFVTVTNSNNCTATASTTTTVYPTPTVTTSNNSPICAGEDLNFRETGGEATGWAWSGPNSFTSTLQNPTISAATTAADGDYFVTVTNNDGCTSTASTSATVYPTPVPTITGTFDFCLGRVATLNAGAYDDMPNTYNWTNNSTSQIIQTSIAGVYTVTVTNQSSCTGTASAEVTAIPCLAEAGTVTTNASSICPGDDVTISVTGENQDLSYTQQYFLYKEDNLGNTTYLSSNATGIFSGLESGDYRVCAYNECTDCSPNPSPLTTNLDDIDDTASIQNGCYDVECQSISVPEEFTPIDGSVSTSVTSTGLNVFVVEVCGGFQPYDEDLTFSGGYASLQEYPGDIPGCIKYQITYATSVEWTLNITDSNGCSGSNGESGLTYSSSGIETILQPQITNVSSTPEKCVGDQDGTIEIEVNHGDNSCGEYTATWTGPGGYSEIVVFSVATLPATTSVANLAAGSYSVVVTDCEGTTITTDVNVFRTGGGARNGRGGRGSGGCKTVLEEELPKMEIFPNPFNHTTTIVYSLAKDAFVELVVYTIEGKLVANLFSENVQADTRQQINFDAFDLPIGTYILQLKTDGGIVHHEQLLRMK